MDNQGIPSTHTAVDYSSNYIPFDLCADSSWIFGPIHHQGDLADIKNSMVQEFAQLTERDFIQEPQVMPGVNIPLYNSIATIEPDNPSYTRTPVHLVDAVTLIDPGFLSPAPNNCILEHSVSSTPPTIIDTSSSLPISDLEALLTLPQHQNLVQPSQFQGLNSFSNDPTLLQEISREVLLHELLSPYPNSTKRDIHELGDYSCVENMLRVSRDYESRPKVLDPCTSKKRKLENFHEERPNKKQEGSKPKKKITDKSHYRARNGYFIFRAFHNRLFREAKSEISKKAKSSRFASASTQRSSSPISNTMAPKGKGLTQREVSVDSGKAWKCGCFESCGIGGCANCRMRSLFDRQSNFMKLRQAEIERLIEFPELNSRNSSPGGSQSNVNGSKNTLNMNLEECFNWEEFAMLYESSDLFKQYRETFQNPGEATDYEGIKQTWLRNEIEYEKKFIECAKSRIFQGKEQRRATKKDPDGGI
ncbi:hypothetical protein BGZ46_009244 [Entomortierella lignicola]|nr:hypothetical protein BGZ46_009244 [Entomortierella lignicola]